MQLVDMHLELIKVEHTSHPGVLGWPNLGR
jgi:hypothetical protein